jgi:chemotaxis signal transduction protein
LATQAIVHFEVSGDRLGLPIEAVREIARVTRVTPVPRSPLCVLGVANIRGRVVTLLDAEWLYGGAPGPPEGHAVVLAPPREHLALFTRARVDIGRGRAAEAPPPPAPSPAGRPSPLEGLVVMNGLIVHMVPPAALEAHCEALILERYRRRA